MDFLGSLISINFNFHLNAKQGISVEIPNVARAVSKTFKDGFSSERWTVEVDTTGVSSFESKAGDSLLHSE